MYLRFHVQCRKAQLGSAAAMWFRLVNIIDVVLSVASKSLHCISEYHIYMYICIHIYILCVCVCVCVCVCAYVYVTHLGVHVRYHRAQLGSVVALECR